jgi:hypothetical protein
VPEIQADFVFTAVLANPPEPPQIRVLSSRQILEGSDVDRFTGELHRESGSRHNALAGRRVRHPLRGAAIAIAGPV